MSKSANKTSVLQLSILTAVNMMGSGIIMLPSKLAQVGALSIVSWLVTAVGSWPWPTSLPSVACTGKKAAAWAARRILLRQSRQLPCQLYLIFANTAIAISMVGDALGFLGTTLDPVMTCAAIVFTLWLATTPHLIRKLIYMPVL